MKLTSAGANKMIKAWNEDLEGLLKKEEAESRTTYGINEEPLPANYDFARMQQQMDALNQKIAVLRHAVNVFNTTTVLEGFGFTIDEALVRMAMLTKKKQRLARMKQVPSLVRTSPGYGSNTPEMTCRNYDAEQVEQEYRRVSDQLTALQREHPEQLAAASRLLMIPEYFNYLLTGNMLNEYTNATSTALVNAYTRSWDDTVIAALGLPRRIFGPLHLPGARVGRFTGEVQGAVGFDCDVLLPATHDTGSAFLAVPARDENAVYISSGTWSLLGVENEAPITGEASMLANFTNEGGYRYRYRYLKNIMGLWMIQSIRRELNGVSYVEGSKKTAAAQRQWSYAELEAEARECADFTSRVDVNDSSFLAPKSMTDAVRYYCERTGQKIPQSMGEVMVVIYNSLAQSYKDTVAELEEMSGRKFSRIHVVGGGCQDMFLNQKIKTFTGKEVYAGPVEGTALGNLMVQMLKDGSFKTLEEARECVASSFDVKKVD